MKKVEKDGQYLYKIYIEVISEFSLFMNLIHSKSFSERYWEILVGPWLWQFINILFDRYCSIKQAVINHNELATYIVEYSHAPKTFLDFYHLIHNDEYNFYLFSEIIRTLKLPINTEFVDLFLSTNSNIQKKKNYSFKQLIRKNVLYPVNKLINFTRAYSWGYFNYFMNINLAIESNDLTKLNKILGQKTYLNPRMIKPLKLHNTVNPNIRDKKLDKIGNQDEFLGLLSKMIVTNLPMEYMEHYNSYRDFSIQLLPRKVKVVGVRGAFELVPKRRFLIAELSEKGTKLITCQEGGGKGVRKINLPDEKISARISDLALTWGWESKEENIKRSYMTKTSWVNDYKYTPDGIILFIGSSCRRYFISFESGQLPIYNKTHLNYNSNMINKLVKDAYDNLVYRFHWQYGYNEVDKILQHFPDLNISLREKETWFYKLFYGSRLIVISTDYTTMLQAFYVNHPTLLLWDPNYFTVRDSAKKYYDLLHKVGILYYSPELCAKKINKIHNNPMEWWMTDKVQSAKNEFSEQFCRKTNDMAGKLAKVINEIKKGGRNLLF